MLGRNSSPYLVTLMMEAIRSSEMSVLTRAMRHNVTEDDILHSHRRETFKSYVVWQVLETIQQNLRFWFD
jgi:hypothetical protein